MRLSGSEPEREDGAGPETPGTWAVEPSANADAGRAADELVAHGMLEYARRHEAGASARRVGALLGAMAPSRRSWRVGPRTARWAVAAAAAMGVIGAFTFPVIPGETRALANVSASLAALRQAPDRRYEIRMSGTRGELPEPVAVIDCRSPSLLVVMHRPPHCPTPMVIGRDGSGEWTVRSDGGIERERPRSLWPPWSLDGQYPLVDSLDRILEQLPRRYALRQLAKEAVPAAAGDGLSGALFERVTAARQDREGPYPHRVEVWLDPVTRLPERVEMHWEPPPEWREDFVGPPSPRGAEGDRYERSRGDRRGHDRPGMVPGDGESAVMGRGLGGPEDGASRGPRERYGGHDTPKDGVKEGAGGERSGGPRRGRGGGLRLIVIQRVESPEHPAAWFTPEYHAARVIGPRQPG